MAWPGMARRGRWRGADQIEPCLQPPATVAKQATRRTYIHIRTALRIAAADDGRPSSVTKHAVCSSPEAAGTGMAPALHRTPRLLACDGQQAYGRTRSLGLSSRRPPPSSPRPRHHPSALDDGKQGWPRLGQTRPGQELRALQRPAPPVKYLPRLPRRHSRVKARPPTPLLRSVDRTSSQLASCARRHLALGLPWLGLLVVPPQSRYALVTPVCNR
ncbi:uncharacterized protein PFL1_02932 [Pseudozyma flocculosa PF-1]|uniref:Uncharacterized protein n=1 Tax=Pseudozyma flocculosa PF-1 TaxID=1277687 RepID=A0A061H9Y6_9BASI|nr:uncharacterized protein PFL1_02932 [Pseudozyma flocculosa PF-1]EPQ29712.1 hypothetical protein PFL1_02932 [Pseudozyma flocculosa PF-1]